MLTGDTLSQWLQRRVGTVVYGPTVRLSPSGLLRVADQPDSHRVQVALPVVHGGQAAVARAAIDGTDRALALRVQAVSSKAEQARQMERLVSMLTVAQAARDDPRAYPSVLPALESFVVTAPGDEMAITSPHEQYELWCDVMPWCPTTLADDQQRRGSAARDPGVVLARVLPMIATVDQVHRLGILHRDITPDNVLVDHTGRLLLADWGVAHTIAADQTSTYTQVVGNRGFSLAPETLAGDTAVGRYTDAWYLGCLLVWMLTGQAPGPHHGPTWLPQGLPGGPAGALLGEVVQGLCWPDPHQRMNLADATTRLARLSGTKPAEWVGPTPARPVLAPFPGPSDPSTALPSGTQTPALPPDASLTAPAVSRRRRTRTAVLVGALVVVVGVAAALVWMATQSGKGASPSSTPTCWTDVDGDCPAFDMAAIGYSVFKGEVGDGTLPQCYQSSPEVTAGTFVTCAWPEHNASVVISKFPDIGTMTDYYLRTVGAEESTDAPRFVDGPDGPVFVLQRDDGTTSYSYCFAELPMCLEAGGNEIYPVTMTTKLFHAISPAQAHQIAEYLARH